MPPAAGAATPGPGAAAAAPAYISEAVAMVIYGDKFILG